MDTLSSMDALVNFDGDEHYMLRALTALHDEQLAVCWIPPLSMHGLLSQAVCCLNLLLDLRQPSYLIKGRTSNDLA